MAITIARRKCAANVRLCSRPVIFLFRPVIRAMAGEKPEDGSGDFVFCARTLARMHAQWL
jgi:hypothetical protein